MGKQDATRTTPPLTEAQVSRLRRQREQIAKELPELIARDQMRKEALEEATLSAELRRTIHASEMSLSKIAAQSGIPALVLDEFLTGERTLRSDAMDRLAGALGWEPSRVP